MGYVKIKMVRKNHIIKKWFLLWK